MVPWNSLKLPRRVITFRQSLCCHNKQHNIHLLSPIKNPILCHSDVRHIKFAWTLKTILGMELALYLSDHDGHCIVPLLSPTENIDICCSGAQHIMYCKSPNWAMQCVDNSNNSRHCHTRTPYWWMLEFTPFITHWQVNKHFNHGV